MINIFNYYFRLEQFFVFKFVGFQGLFQTMPLLNFFDTFTLKKLYYHIPFLLIPDTCLAILKYAHNVYKIIQLSC